MSVENQIKLAAEEGNIAVKVPFALCVDDEPTNVEILEMHLKKAGVKSKGFYSGAEVLDYVNAYNGSIDLILLDIMMPGIDGIQVLKTLKANPKTAKIPVIMQTAIAQENKTIEGIESGAYYYITKPYSHAVLISIVKSALREKKEIEGLKGEVINLYSVIENIKSCVFEIKNFKEARKLANYIARFSSEPGKYVMGLTALLINAIEHGNLELGFEEKKIALLEKSYEVEIEKRLKNHIYYNRKVTVELFRKEEEGIYSVIIKDEGTGFSWQDYLDFDPTRITEPSGRGIAIANIMNPNAIEFWGRGNVVLFKMPIKKQES
jgi:DNA-binding response OmpR family regulator